MFSFLFVFSISCIYLLLVDFTARLIGRLTILVIQEQTPVVHAFPTLSFYFHKRCHLLLFFSSPIHTTTDLLSILGLLQTRFYSDRPTTPPLVTCLVQQEEEPWKYSHPLFIQRSKNVR